MLTTNLIGVLARVENLPDHIHALHNLGKRREALAVQERVIGIVDEDLRVSAVGLPRHCKGDETHVVALHHRIVLNRVAPLSLDGGIPIDAELHHLFDS